MANSVYTYFGVRISIDIADMRFLVLCSLLSASCNSSGQYNNSNITDTGELFSGSGSGYEGSFRTQARTADSGQKHA